MGKFSRCKTTETNMKLDLRSAELFSVRLLFVLMRHQMLFMDRAKRQRLKDSKTAQKRKK